MSKEDILKEFADESQEEDKNQEDAKSQGDLTSDTNDETQGDNDDQKLADNDKQNLGDDVKKEEKETIPKSRFDQIYKQNKDLERRLGKYIDQKVGYVPSITEQKSKPQVDDFESTEEYIEALTDWKVNQKYNEHYINQQKHNQEMEKRSVEANIQRKVQAQVQTDPKFLEKAYIPVEIADLVHDSDKFAELGYFFAENRDLAVQLCHAPKHVASREIGRIEAYLENVKNPTVKTKTDAPRGTTSIDGKATVGTKDPDKMNDTEFDAWFAENFNPYRKRR
jgi:hypothetical protein